MRERALLIAVTACGVLVVGAVWFLAKGGWPHPESSDDTTDVRPYVEALRSIDTAPGGVDRTNTAEGQARARAEPSAATEPPAPPTTPLFEANALYGRILTRPEEGELAQPIPGASILIFAGHGRTEEGIPPEHVVEADEDGRFRVRELEELSSYHIHVQAPGHVPFTRRIQSGIDHELLLAPAAPVRGLVLGRSSEEPLAGIEVRTRALHYDGEAWSLEERAVTDSDGRFELAWTTGGAKSLTLGGAGRSPVTEKVALESGTTNEIELLLDEGMAAQVRLVAWPGEAPLGRLEAEVDGYPRTSDAAGAIALVLAAEESRPAQVRFEAPGYCTTSARLAVPETTGATAQVHMAPGAGVEGVVRDADGKPLAGARVWLGKLKTPHALPRPSKRESLVDAVRETHTDASGHYTIQGIVPRTRPIEVHAFLPGTIAARVEVDCSTPGRVARADLELFAGSSIAGTVTVDGEPASALVRWTSEEGSGSARANDAGHYLAGGVPPGPIEVHAEPDEMHGFRDEPRPFHLRDGETLQVDLALETGRLPIRGRVIGEDGETIPGVPILARGRMAVPGEAKPAWVGSRAVSEGGGEFELRVAPLAQQGYRLSARVGTRVAYVEGVRAGMSEVELVLPLAGRIGLDVRDALSDEALERFEAFWRAEPGASYQRYSRRGGPLVPNSDGVVWLELPRGEVDLRVGAPWAGYPTVDLPRNLVRAEDEARIETLHLDHGVKLIVLFQEEGKKKKRANPPGKLEDLLLVTPEQFAARREGGDWYRETVNKRQRVSPRKGRAVVHGMAPGTYQWKGKPKDVRFTPSAIEVRTGDPSREPGEQRVIVRWKRKNKGRGK